MSSPKPTTPTRALVVRGASVLSDSNRQRRSVRSGVKHWQPPEGLSPDEVRAVIAAARTERDRLLLRVLWATGARVSEVLALRPMDVRRDSLVLPNRKNPNRTVKRVFLPGPSLDSQVSSSCGPGNMASRTTSRSSSRASTASTARVVRFDVGRRGSSSRKHRSGRRWVGWRSAPRNMGWSVSPRRCIRICSGMRGYARSCASPGVCLSPSARRAGRACSPLI
jgi:hypothetical protein